MDRKRSTRLGLSGVVSVLIILVMVLFATTTVFSYLYTTNANNQKQTSTVTITTSSYCVQTVAGTLRVMIVQDGIRAPVAGANIYGAETDGCGTFRVGPVATQSDGSVLVAGDVADYFLVANYAGHNYSFIATVYPVRTTNVTITIPSGNVSTSYSQPFSSGA